MKKIIKIALFVVIIANSINVFSQTNWLKGNYGNGYDYGNVVRFDKQGNIIVIGSYGLTSSNDSIVIQGTTLHSLGGSDGFIAKYSNNGNLIWVKRFGWTWSERGNDVAFDSQNNIYIAGGYQGLTIIGNDTLTGLSGDSEIFITKLDANGNFIWTKTTGSLGADGASSICIDQNDGIYITGTFNGYATQYQSAFGGTTLQGLGFSDIFVAKMNTSGSWIWAKRIASSNSDYSNSIIVDSNNDLYITGKYSDTLYTDSGNLISNGQSNGFLVKMNSTGQIISKKSIIGTNGAEGLKLAKDASNNTYLIGNSSSATLTIDAISLNNMTGKNFLAKFNSSGVIQWITDLGNYSVSAINVSDRIYVIGFYNYSLSIGDKGVSSSTSNSYEIYIAVLNLSGYCSNILTAVGNSGSDYSYSLDVKDNQLVFTGYYTNSLMFNNTTVSTNGQQDYVLGSISTTSINNVDSISGNNQICNGSSNNLFSVNTYPNVTSYIWTVPYFATGSSTTNAISISLASNSFGDLKVKLATVDGTGVEVIKKLSYLTPPTAPSITLSANILTSSLSTGNQWYLNSTQISGAVNQTYSPTQSGNYFVIVTSGGCASDTSNIINFTSSGIDEKSEDRLVSIFPNPSKDNITIRCNNYSISKIEIIDLYGHVIYEKEIKINLKESNIDISFLNNGMYLLRINNNNKVILKKFTKN